jgi:hypothetical protein
MAFYRRYALLLAAIALVLIVVLLLSSPGSALSPGGTFIGTDLNRQSGDEVYVRTKMDIGSAEGLREFPMQFGVWTGAEAPQYDVEEMRETFGADIVFLRDYECAGLYQPLDVLIMQAATDVSFRSLKTCYIAHGYEIVEEGKETVSIPGVGWTSAGQELTVPLSRMIVSRQREGTVYQRLVVLYFYVRRNQLSGDDVTMLRVQALTAPEGSYTGILSMEKSFLAEAIPHLFEPDDRSEWSPLAVRLAGLGASGYVAIAVLLLIPVAIGLYPRVRWGRGSLSGHID